MKKMILVASIAALAVSCKKADLKEIDSIMQKGTWSVTKFIEDGVDETNDFGGYSFFFKSKTDVDATISNTTTAGTWETFRDDNVYKFKLEFNAPDGNLLDEIEDDWDVVTFTSTYIELKDVSGDGTTDYLTLTRN